MSNLKEDFNKFKTGIEKITSKHGGLSPGKKWFTVVQEKHLSLRKAIGGIRITKKIKFDDKDLKAFINPEEIDGYLKGYLSTSINLESLLKKEKLKWEDLYGPYLNINGKNISTCKALTYWIDKSTADDYHKKMMKNTVSAVGGCYPKPDGDEYSVTLTTSAISFALLGHYGADAGSCFGQDGCNSDHKFGIGATTNSFVLLIKNGEDKTIGRAWGASSKNHKTWFVYNFYLKHINRKKAECMIKDLYCTITETDPTKARIYEGASVDSEVYDNGDGIVIGERRPKNPYKSFEDDTSQFGFGYCEYCDVPCDTDGMKTIMSGYYRTGSKIQPNICEECFDNIIENEDVKKCHVTKCYTYDFYEARTTKNRKIYINAYNTQEYKPCNDCFDERYLNIYYPKDMIVNGRCPRCEKKEQKENKTNTKKERKLVTA